MWKHILVNKPITAGNHKHSTSLIVTTFEHLLKRSVTGIFIKASGIIPKAGLEENASVYSFLIK